MLDKPNHDDNHLDALLSPLDAAVGSFTEAIRDIDRDLHPRATGAAFERYTFCGEDIERWMLKCLIGMVFSGNINGVLKPECLDLLFDRIPWPDKWGLYWQNDNGNEAYHSDSFMVSTEVHPETQAIMLVRFTLRGLPFGLCLGRPDHPTRFGLLRPKALTFKAKARSRVILLNWSRARSGPPVILRHAGTYDGLPPDWAEWERNS